MTDQEYREFFLARWGKEPNKWQIKNRISAEDGLRFAVQPDVQYYRPYRGKKIRLTGTTAERKAAIQKADEKTLGEEDAAGREILNLT